jgi:hypothetical protein
MYKTYIHRVCLCVCVYRRLAAKDTELNAKMAKIEELRMVNPKS